MAASLAAVMAGLEERLKTIDGLRVTDENPNQINPPAAWVGVPPIPDYHTTMIRGIYMIAPTITVMVSKVLTRAGQLQLAALASPDGDLSIHAAIRADKTLGGVAQECVVSAFRPLGTDEVGALGYYGGVFIVTVHARGN